MKVLLSMSRDDEDSETDSKEIILDGKRMLWICLAEDQKISLLGSIRSIKGIKNGTKILNAHWRYKPSFLYGPDEEVVKKTLINMG